MGKIEKISKYLFRNKITFCSVFLASVRFGVVSLLLSAQTAGRGISDGLWGLEIICATSGSAELGVGELGVWLRLFLSAGGDMRSVGVRREVCRIWENRYWFRGERIWPWWTFGCFRIINGTSAWFRIGEEIVCFLYWSVISSIGLQASYPLIR